MALRMSTLLLRTLREDPAEAEVPSHRLLVRAGYVRRLAPGIYTYLPLGRIVLANIERVVREEMDAIGGQEVLFPAHHPEGVLRSVGPVGRLRRLAVHAVRPQARGVPPGADARGALHHAGEGRDVVVQGVPEDHLPDPDEVPRRGPAAGRHPARSRVPHEGLVLVRPRRGGPPGRVRPAPRGLHPDLRPAGDRLPDRAGRLGRDGRDGVRGVPGDRAERRGHVRVRHGQRLRRERRGRDDRRAAVAGGGAPGHGGARHARARRRSRRSSRG